MRTHRLASVATVVALVATAGCRAADVSAPLLRPPRAAPPTGTPLPVVVDTVASELADAESCGRPMPRPVVHEPPPPECLPPALPGEVRPPNLASYVLVGCTCAAG